MKKIGRKYGSASTHLWLTAKAKKAYDGTYPLEIWEYVDIDENGASVYSYDFRGLYDDKALTEQEVIETLEELYDDTFTPEEDD